MLPGTNRRYTKFVKNTISDSFTSYCCARASWTVGTEIHTALFAVFSRKDKKSMNHLRLYTTFEKMGVVGVEYVRWRCVPSARRPVDSLAIMFAHPANALCTSCSKSNGVTRQYADRFPVLEEEGKKRLPPSTSKDRYTDMLAVDAREDRTHIFKTFMVMSSPCVCRRTTNNKYVSLCMTTWRHDDYIFFTFEPRTLHCSIVAYSVLYCDQAPPSGPYH